MQSGALMLVSPNLPIGSFSYSQALESAVENGLVTSEEDFSKWLEDNLRHSLVKNDLPLLIRLYRSTNKEEFLSWTNQVIALRTTKEFRSEERDKGKALTRLIESLDFKVDKDFLNIAKESYLAAFVLFGKAKQVNINDILYAYTFSYIEAICICAIKLVPLGQTSAWRIIENKSKLIDDLVKKASLIEDDLIGTGLFNLAIQSVLHETLYSRIFRS